MLLAPPPSTFVARHLVKALERMGAISLQRARMLAVTAFLVIFAVDFASGRVVSLALFYVMVVAFVAWRLGERPGLLAAGLTAATAPLLVELHLIFQPGSFEPLEPMTATWNFGTRLVAFVILVLLVSGLRQTVELERWRADTDGLTGVLNKGAFRRRMASSIDNAIRRERALVLAYMDLDGFKGVNDRHGHSAGDEVLAIFAFEAASVIRERDLFARIGGDEFIALLTVPDCNHGDMVAEMLHDRLSAILKETRLPVTCSMGALVVDSSDVGAHDDFIAMADKLMYEVKRSGKNALRIARGGCGQYLASGHQPPDGLIARAEWADSSSSRRAVA